MAINRLVSRGHEEIEFLPVPGAEEEWAGYQYIDRSRLWWYFGVLPIGLWFVFNLLLIGMVAA